MRHKAVLVAAAGAAGYTISKVDLALRGELGMPGFPASAASYADYEPVSGQLSNAAMGAAMVTLIALLARPPRRRWVRWGLFAANGVSAVLIGCAVMTFTARAAGLAPGLGAPAEGAGPWVVLAMGAIWVVAWMVAVVAASRSTRTIGRADAAVVA